MNKSFLQRVITFLTIFALMFGNWVDIAVVASDPVPTKEPAPSKEPASIIPPRERSKSKDSSPTVPPSSPAPENKPIPTSQEIPTDSNSTSQPTPTGQSSKSSETESDTTPTPTTDYHKSQGSTGTLGYQTGNPNYPTNTSQGSNASSTDDPKNVDTGPFSSNSGSLTNSSSSDVNNQNKADILNKLGLQSITGENNASFSTLEGNVITGDALANLALLNKLNANFTGSGGVLTFDIFDQHVGDILLDWIDAVDSGFSDGTPDGSISSASGAVVENSITGPFSQNDGEQIENNDTKVSNKNDATVEQDITVIADTGNNSASFNTLGGNIKTGDANAFASVLNFVNTNIMVNNWLIGIVNIFGSLFGNIVLPPGDYSSSGDSTNNGGVLVKNNGTGPFSQNEATTTASDSTTQQNTNNASVVNNVSVNAETGANDASMNTYGGSISSGDSSVNINENTVANTNATGDTVWLIIVNQLGHWVGYIIGSPWGATTTSSDNLPILDGNPTAKTYVGNHVTGPYSENSTELTQTTDETVNNQNDAQLVNDITVQANTGNNDALANTGAGNIETGEATAGLNLFNMVNTNVVGKKFVALFVNVIGDFIGSIIPPDVEAIPISAHGDDFRGGLLADNDLGNPAVTGSQTQFLPDTTQDGSDSTSSNGDSSTSDSDVTNTQKTQYMTSGSTTQEPTTSSSIKPNYRYLTGREVRKTQSRTLGTVYSTATSELFKAYSTPLSTKYTRGPFVSIALAKASKGTTGGLLFFGSKYEVTDSWLVILPIAVFIVLIRRRYVFVPIKRYVTMLMEVIL